MLFATLFRGSQEPIVDIESTLSAFTLMLSEFSWWGDFYYLAFLVPWLASCCMLTFLVYRFNDGARKRALFAGFSILIYYCTVWLFFLVHGLTHGWGDIAYDLFWLWPLFGFGFGYVAATVVERVSKPQVVG